MRATFRHRTPTRAFSDYIIKKGTVKMLLRFGNCVQNEGNSWPKQPVGMNEYLHGIERTQQ
eukprot:6198834-Pleurochrysis_carterae.AAC.1